MLSKLLGYKISTQKSVGFLYTKNEQAEKEIRKAITFTIASKKLTFLLLLSFGDILL
jgi:hypothetical protein